MVSCFVSAAALHTEQAAVTGADARLALQQARQEMQSLLKTAKSAAGQSSVHGPPADSAAQPSRLPPVYDTQHDAHPFASHPQLAWRSLLDQGNRPAVLQNMSQQYKSQQLQPSPAAPSQHWSPGNESMSPAQGPASRQLSVQSDAAELSPWHNRLVHSSASMRPDLSRQQAARVLEPGPLQHAQGQPSMQATNKSWRAAHSPHGVVKPEAQLAMQWPCLLILL